MTIHILTIFLTGLIQLFSIRQWISDVIPFKPLSFIIGYFSFFILIFITPAVSTFYIPNPNIPQVGRSNKVFPYYHVGNG